MEGERLSALGAAIAADFAAEIEEADVNPLRCGPRRALAVDALIMKKTGN